jgi:hypothetical protein
MPLDNPCALLDQLEPTAIRNRIAELDRERAALLVLLRAVDARRGASAPGRPAGKEATRAT